MLHTVFLIESMLATQASAMLAALPGMCPGMALLVREYRRMQSSLFPESRQKRHSSDINCNKITSAAGTARYEGRN